MSDRGAPLSGLYIFAGVCALFAILYGALDLEPGPLMSLVLFFGPAIGVTMWLAADAKRTRLVGAHDAGLLFYLTWPLLAPWYLVRTRGRGGWWLAAQLYAIAFVAYLGLLWGATLRFLFRG
jgi:hypothetical protein